MVIQHSLQKQLVQLVENVEKPREHIVETVVLEPQAGTEHQNKEHYWPFHQCSRPQRLSRRITERRKSKAAYE